MKSKGLDCSNISAPQLVYLTGHSGPRRCCEKVWPFLSGHRTYLDGSIFVPDLLQSSSFYFGGVSVLCSAKNSHETHVTRVQDIAKVEKSIANNRHDMLYFL